MYCFANKERQTFLKFTAKTSLDWLGLGTGSSGSPSLALAVSTSLKWMKSISTSRKRSGSPADDGEDAKGKRNGPWGKKGEED